MAKFEYNIVSIEGGLDNDPQDRGGLTKYGISQKTYPNLDIANLTPAKAFALYEKDFWNRNRLGEINSQEVADRCFILIVNLGQQNGVKLIQRALWELGFFLSFDGIIGTKTLSAINSLAVPMIDRLLDCIRLRLCHWYLDIVERDKTQAKYFQGWIKRALI